jgi:prepilin-type N-terminal cleavage/methylation domain-containing protein
MRGQRGFTVLEIMVALMVFAIGSAGIVALLTTTIASHRTARRLERAKSIAVQSMEDLRSTAITATASTTRLADVTTPEGVTYYRRWQVTPSATSETLAVVSVVAGWLESDPSSAPSDPFSEPEFHGARVHMLRTTTESL